MKIELRRIKRTAEVIDGHLFIDGQKICDTAENAKGALPEGEYPVSIVYCKQYKRKVLVLSPVEGLRLEAATLSNPVRSAGITKPESEIWLEASTRCDRCPQMKWVFYDTTLPIYCPQLKIGNGVYNRPDGSIIVGTHIVPGSVLRSKDAYDPLYQRIRKSIERGNEVVVTIKNEFDQ